MIQYGCMEHVLWFLMTNEILKYDLKIYERPPLLYSPTYWFAMLLLCAWFGSWNSHLLFFWSFFRHAISNISIEYLCGLKHSWLLCISACDPSPNPFGISYILHSVMFRGKSFGAMKYITVLRFMRILDFKKKIFLFL